MKSAVKAFVLFALFGTTLIHAQSLPTFRHVVLVVQENRTPDNLFGGNPTFEPGVDLQLAPDAVQWCLGACSTLTMATLTGRARIGIYLLA